MTREERLIEPMTGTASAGCSATSCTARRTSARSATSVVRDGDADAFTGGGDYNIRWNSNRYVWNGHWLGTHAPIDGS